MWICIYVDMNCQQICKISRKRLNRSENISKCFRGYFLLKHPVYELILCVRKAMRAEAIMSRCVYVPIANIGIFSLHTNFERISMKCDEVSLPPTDESADYTLGEIVPRTREQDMTENSNRRQTGAAT